MKEEREQMQESKQRNHGIIEWAGLEGAPKTTQIQPSGHGQGHPPLDQGAQMLNLTS